MDTKVITRFAPSPTGFMHVGNVRTALYAWLWARKNKGIFILRIEDTDKKREVAGSIDHIKKSLLYFGLDWDQGPDIGGPYSPYVQSERLEKLNIYKKYADKLIEKGYAYADTSSEEEIEKFRKDAEENKKAFLFRDHRPENPPEWKIGVPLRFKVRDIKRTSWNDAVRGELTAGPEALDDFVLIKSDGYPTYNFAHIVDDIEMGITHVIRGQEFISSTPNYIAVYEALGAKEPIYVTAPPIMGSEGNKKMGKRDGAKDTLEYEREGYLPEAMFNFLTFLGWNPGTEKEIMTREEIIEAFDINKIQKSGAQFNEEKLDWMNKEHMKKLSDVEFLEKAKKYIDFVSPINESDLNTIILTFRDRINKFSDLNHFLRGSSINGSVVVVNKHHAVGHENVTLNNSNQREKTTILVSGPNDYLVSAKDPKISKIEILIPKDSDTENTIKYLTEIKNIIQKSSEENTEKNNWEKIIEKNDESELWVYATKEGRGKVLWPLRVSLSGEMKSPDPFEIMKIIKKDAVLRRIDNAILQLKNNLL